MEEELRWTKTTQEAIADETTCSRIRVVRQEAR